MAPVCSYSCTGAPLLLWEIKELSVLNHSYGYQRQLFNFMNIGEKHCSILWKCKHSVLLHKSLNEKKKFIINRILFWHFNPSVFSLWWCKNHWINTHSSLTVYHKSTSKTSFYFTHAFSSPQKFVTASKVCPSYYWSKVVSINFACWLKSCKKLQ